MGQGGWLIAFLVAQRLAELGLARWNANRLLARGGVEFGGAHYPLLVALHAFWIMALWVFGHDRPVNLFWLAVFAALQAGRVWVIASLGRRWTTRVIVLPGSPPVANGPYRFIRHPNYWVVTGEIAVVPLALGLPALALIFSLANAAVLYLRISTENAALAWAASAASVGVRSLAKAGARR
ncbi:MAG: isoprenylcysteine carboxyl methyltransferase family protein [Pseudolabrys sp.]